MEKAHPSFKVMIYHAIEHLGPAYFNPAKGGRAVTLPAIKKYILVNYNISEEVVKRQLKRRLAVLVETGMLEKPTVARYKLTDSYKKAMTKKSAGRPKKSATKKKSAAKKKSATKKKSAQKVGGAKLGRPAKPKICKKETSKLYTSVKRKAPPYNARYCDVGTKKKGNDKKMWEVRLVSGIKGAHRWYRV